MNMFGEEKGDFMKSFLSVLAVLVTMTIGTSEAEAASCTMELQNGRGRVLEVFRERGYDRQEACSYARRSCNRVKNGRYYRAPIQQCVKVGGRGGRRIVERRCSAEMTGPRGGRTFGYFTARASGQRGSGVKGDACRKAMRKCLRSAERQGRMRAVCTDERGRSQRVRQYSPRPHRDDRVRRGSRRGRRN